ncbi:dual specificity protein kinase zakA-like [Hibiscus syriacus]|uniref:Dual specificity protein kinase zakA-like n=1 Tax=Hibiscus syriacus TaxID=106335 RepID=A0A6A2ZWK4_HIBSY|nr:dual specificity protein kinase zakA-like [Hibiscus syriacus]
MKGMAFIVVALVMVMAIADAQTICNMPTSGLMACKPAVTPPKPPPPTSTCCLALSHADMRCLCSYKNSKLLPTLGIDPNLAMKLPSLCKLPHPANC